MKKQILMIIMTVLLLGGCNRKQEWQLHYEQAEKLAEEGNHGLALEQMDAAIALKSDDPALYLMTATYHHVDDRIMGIDHYVQGILAYTEDIDLKTGEVTIIEHDPLLSTPAEELEDWEKEYELAIGFSNSGDHTGTIEHLSEAIRLSPDKAFLYTNRAAEYLRASFNGKDLSVEDPRKIYDLVSEDLKKAEELLQEGEEPAVSVEFVRDLLEDWKKIVSFEG